MAVATWQDVAVALGRPSSDFTADQQGQMTWWLNGVELFIVARLGPADGLDATTVKYVEVEAVAAKVNRAGRSESSVTVTVDDGTVTRRYDNPVTASDITDDWWQLLDPDSSAASASIRPGYDADTAMWPSPAPGDPFCSPDLMWRTQ